MKSSALFIGSLASMLCCLHGVFSGKLDAGIIPLAFVIWLAVCLVEFDNDFIIIPVCCILLDHSAAWWSRSMVFPPRCTCVPCYALLAILSCFAARSVRDKRSCSCFRLHWNRAANRVLIACVDHAIVGLVLFALGCAIAILRA